MPVSPRPPENEATPDDDATGAAVPFDEALGFAALDPQDAATSENVPVRHVLERPKRPAEPVPRPSGDTPPRPLIRPAQRSSGLVSAKQSAMGTDVSGRVQAPHLPPDAPLLKARGEPPSEPARLGARRPTADISEQAPPALPVLPAQREDDAAPTFQHTVRGYSRAQVEDLAGLGRTRTSTDTPARSAPANVADDAAPQAAASAVGHFARPDALEAKAAVMPVAPPSAPRAPEAAPSSARSIDPRDREIRAPRPLSEAPPWAADPTLTVLRAPPPQLLKTVSLVALLLLISALALPTAGGPPWELLARPAEVTMQALAAFILLAVVHLLPTRERTRAVLGLVAGALLLGFAFVAWRVAAARGVFDAQPALDALFGGKLPNPALPALAALLLLPAGLFARRLDARSTAAPVAAWITSALGLALALLTIVWMGPSALFASLTEAPFLGDRIAAWTTLPLLVHLVVALLGAFLPRLAASAKTLGFLVWGLSLAPLVVLALFAAKSDQWLQVLEPLKLVIFLAALSIYTSAALASAIKPAC